MKKILILGSTGSIGRQALDVIARHPDRLSVCGLAANRSEKLLREQAARYRVPDRALALCTRDGMDALLALIDTTEPDMVLNAMVGAAGTRATVYTLRAQIPLALANKESLVVAGDWVMPLTARSTLIPVDSEHSAIYQCLLGENRAELTRIWLTASGGPFRGRTREQLRTVTAADALAHPTWNMGAKITVDSAGMMNKGLEVIEAHHLFGVDYDAIDVLLQPQSLIHSMVEFADGVVIGHLGAPDMRVPIQYAFSHPERWDAPTPPVDFRALTALELGDPDTATFECLQLAYDAGRAGGAAPCVLNAANEVAVAAFLAGEIGFPDIPAIVRTALDDRVTDAPGRTPPTDDIEGGLAYLMEIDRQVRESSLKHIRRRHH
ncbi:MAG: 1-deoxy-D-xylulose-5-phosphate reductoisomerase [Actinomycetes bacterium]|jgi:1-deoxy-D-xylulose-5-phosphate reductoisomerase|nr:1-deoxy-D-xylulose-5-phosphate reductoisomerase [Actinomycetes bacterium]